MAATPVYCPSTSDTSNGEIQEPMKKRGLKSRHAQLIALGGTIGTALFVGSGVNLAKGGPAFMLIAYILMSEFYFASLKVITIIGLLILSFVIFKWGGPGNPRLGFHYWKDPSAVNPYILEGLAGYAVSFWSTLISALLPFSFAPEMLVFCCGEMKSPRRNLPRAAKSFIVRILVFYVGSVIAIGVICPSNEKELTNGTSGAGSSPFVLGIKRAGIKGLDSVIDAAILTSAWSAGNAFIFQSSRSLYSMALKGQAPKIFTKCTLRCVLASSAFSLLAYLNVSSKAGEVFSWFVNLVNTAVFISWICCAISAFAAQELPSEDLPYTSRFQPWSSYACIGIFSVLYLINGFEVFLPSSWSVSSFFSAYIGIPIFLILYFGHRLTAGRSDAWCYSLHDIDLTTGLEDLKAEE
ncbi:unnamed protein product [Clonostachys rhizophaga]|uniref:Amino acid permease/ SLC12A domain-containing protein n=1 Tax=Clonostachys rhizophaga TaxID=160324 RepID=A0A9N9VV60_9HYPO|nr:unnamed protein product [Clonostachys rhizophaga]